MAFHYKQEYERYRRYYQSLEPIWQKPSTQAYTSIIFSFLAVSLFGWYAIKPTMQTIFTLKREIKDKTEISKKMEDKISLLIEAQAAFEDIQSSIPALTQAIPQAPEVVSAMRQITYLATDSRVTITAMTVPNAAIEPTKADGKISDATISLSVSGSYPQIKAFLEEITTLRRIMTIDSMTMTTGSSSIASSSASSSVQVDLKLKVYYLAQ